MKNNRKNFANRCNFFANAKTEKFITQESRVKNFANRGITLMELIIVLAIISIIAGIVALNLFGTTDRARLRSDVQSTIVLRSAIEMYSLGAERSIGNNVESLLVELNKHGYISSIPDTQTEAVWVIQNGTIYLNVPENINTDFLNNNERSVISY